MYVCIAPRELKTEVLSKSRMKLRPNFRCALDHDMTFPNETIDNLMQEVRERLHARHATIFGRSTTMSVGSELKEREGTVRKVANGRKSIREIGQLG